MFLSLLPVFLFTIWLHHVIPSVCNVNELGSRKFTSYGIVAFR
uniref:Uncharacterized protein n=1 Tax=Rhizophora mucronata TaxID=61149 RepID=A0A2P2IWA2_RHIMU